ncbi:hypothetical protein QJS10_CPA07g00277 [Acorus calamus]|uniref:Uncharacterized protein n=1 Tax=Acorus calamus TaxID=4465 RepID=A0AAV9EF01_ACOCL|nr:hypothetical protein QJS10_CPA07g00277 [Acorus calamus]
MDASYLSTPPAPSPPPPPTHPPLKHLLKFLRPLQDPSLGGALGRAAYWAYTQGQACNSLVLASTSQFFLKLFSNGMKESQSNCGDNYALRGRCLHGDPEFHVRKDVIINDNDEKFIHVV